MCERMPVVGGEHEREDASHIKNVVFICRYTIECTRVVVLERKMKCAVRIVFVWTFERNLRPGDCWITPSVRNFGASTCRFLIGCFRPLH